MVGTIFTADNLPYVFHIHAGGKRLSRPATGKLSMIGSVLASLVLGELVLGNARCQ